MNRLSIGANTLPTKGKYYFHNLWFRFGGEDEAFWKNPWKGSMLLAKWASSLICFWDHR